MERIESVNTLKYLFKYLNKPDERANFEVFRVVNGQRSNEIDTYRDSRWMCVYEALYGIFRFPLAYASHSFFSLDVHLKNQQRVVFGADLPPNDAELDRRARTTLTAYFNYNRDHPNDDTRHLTYIQFADSMHWIAARKEWVSKGGRRNAVPADGVPAARPVPVRGRGHVAGAPADNRRYPVANPYIPHFQKGELFFIHVLLRQVPGPTSFEDLLTVNGEIQNTFENACKLRGINMEEVQWEFFFEEILDAESPSSSRKSFAFIIQAGV